MQTHGVPTADFRRFWIQTGKSAEADQEPDGVFTGHMALLHLTAPLFMGICLRLYLFQLFQAEVNITQTSITVDKSFFKASWKGHL